MASQNGATIEGACGLIDAMIRTLRAGKISNFNFSSTNKIPLSTVDESANLITDDYKDVHRCKACGETNTLSPKLWKKFRDRPDDFE